MQRHAILMHVVEKEQKRLKLQVPKYALKIIAVAHMLHTITAVPTIAESSLIWHYFDTQTHKPWEST